MDLKPSAEALEEVNRARAAAEEAGRAKLSEQEVLALRKEQLEEMSGFLGLLQEVTPRGPNEDWRNIKTDDETGTVIQARRTSYYYPKDYTDIDVPRDEETGYALELRYVSAEDSQSATEPIELVTLTDYHNGNVHLWIKSQFGLDGGDAYLQTRLPEIIKQPIIDQAKEIEQEILQVLGTPVRSR